MMMKFTKLSEDSSKIIYKIFDGLFGTVEYDKATKSVFFFDESGKEYEDRLEKAAFYQVIQAGFPNEYVYAAG